jgi:uncharacterized protein YciI
MKAIRFPGRHGGGLNPEEDALHYIIHCLDKPGALPARLANYAAHRAYLAAPSVTAPSVKIVISGPLVGDDNETMIGSCFLVEADGKDAVIAFNRRDPFHAAGIWERVEIHPFLKRMDNRT